MSADGELVADYALKGSEEAFRALVNRHVSLVYATALRQVGDPGLAEEVTQNVFVTLSQKASRLTGIETVAGWLHRTTILESKARLRSEIRRRKREEIAAELAAIHSDGTSPLAPLASLLDEGLVHLKESDRVALILRFLEERSLREVGQTMGVDEDAARKRVARALDRLSSFFRQRGFTVSTVAITSVVLTNSVQAAPSGLAATACQAGLAAGGAASGINLFIYHLMALTKTQTAVVCSLLAAAPLVYQWNAVATAKSVNNTLSATVSADQAKASQLESQVRQFENARKRAQLDEQRAQLRLLQLDAERKNRVPRIPYHWNDASDVARMPKSFLEPLSQSIESVNNARGQLSEQIKNLLQMSPAESDAAQAAMDRFVTDYHTAEARKTHLVQPKEDQLYGHKPEEIRAFEIEALGSTLDGLQARLFAELDAILGPERLGLFRNGLKRWMQENDSPYGVGNGTAIFNTAHSAYFYKPQKGNPQVQFGTIQNQNYVSSFVDPDDIPQHLRVHLQDWIDLLQSEPEQP